jgi:hypothetical protein
VSARNVRVSLLKTCVEYAGTPSRGRLCRIIRTISNLSKLSIVQVVLKSSTLSASGS